MANMLSWRVGSLDKPTLPYDRVAAIGLRYVEVIWPEGMTAAEAKELLEPHGIRVGTVTAPLPLAEDSLFDDFEQSARLAAEMGAKAIFSSAKVGDLPLEEAYKRLRRVGDIAAEHGMKVGLETHPVLCHNAEVAIRTLDAVNHPALGMNFDTANIYYYNEGINGTDELRKVAPRVVSVHLKDTHGGYHDGAFPIFGQGIVDFAAAFKVLNDLGFHGPFTMELEGSALKADSLEQMEQHVVGCMDHLRKLQLV